MPVSDLPIKSAVEALPPQARLMGLDLGTKTIGVATSDLTRQIATPIEVIARKKFTEDATRLMEIARRENIGLFVLGLPVNMDGSEGPRAQSTRAFARNLARLTDIPITFWDERLSSAEANRVLAGSGAAKGTVDKIAAVLILQGYLDAHPRRTGDDRA